MARRGPGNLFVCVCVCVVKQCVSRSAPLSLSFPPFSFSNSSVIFSRSNGGSFQTVCSAIGYRGAHWLGSDDRTVHMHNYALIPAAFCWCFRLVYTVAAFCNQGIYFPFCNVCPQKQCRMDKQKRYAAGKHRWLTKGVIKRPFNERKNYNIKPGQMALA